MVAAVALPVEAAGAAAAAAVVGGGEGLAAAGPFECAAESRTARPGWPVGSRYT